MSGVRRNGTISDRGRGSIKQQKRGRRRRQQPYHTNKFQIHLKNYSFSVKCAIETPISIFLFGLRGSSEIRCH